MWKKVFIQNFIHSFKANFPGLSDADLFCNKIDSVFLFFDFDKFEEVDKNFLKLSAPIDSKHDFFVFNEAKSLDDEYDRNPLHASETQIENAIFESFNLVRDFVIATF